MTDTYGSFERQARVQAIGAIDDDPEQASRALKLEEASGVNASVIHADVEGFDRQFKSQLTSQIIQKNSHLQDYINSHPMAAKVSSDDWAQLDVVSEHLKPFGDLTMEGSLKNFAEGFSKGAGPEGIGKWLREQPGGAEFAQKYPYSAAAWYALGAPIEVPLRLFSGSIQGGAEAVSGWVAGLADVAGVGDQDLKEKVKESIITTADMYFTGRMSGNIHPTPGVGQVKNHNESLHRAVIQAYTKNLDEIEQAIAPYVDAGEPIPVGLHPAIDKIKVEQSKLDIKALDNAFKEMQKTTTLERSPEMAKLFAEIKDKTQIGIKSDAIQELYGDKPPSPDDGILGWLPDIASRLEEAKATGGDIEISLADALTKISPEVYDELHDHIRIRPSGLTVEEGKELGKREEPTKVLAQEGEEPPPPSIVDQVRTQAALNPLFEEGPIENLKLKKVAPKNEFGSTVSHNFKISDEKGRDVGEVLLTEKDKGKTLYIEWIQNNLSKANEFTKSSVRELGRQLREQFPNAEFLEGERVSGGREGTEQEGAMVRIPLKALRDEPFGLDSVEGSDHLKELQDFFGGQWNKINDTISSLEPTDVWKKNEQTIIDNVNKVLNRIIPKGVEHAPSRAVALRGRQVHGLYAQFEDALPLLLWSLKGRNERLGKVDPLHTAKHEAMHHLIEEGFYTPKEVEILEDAAVNNGWIEKHGIESRYGGEKLQLKIREAISEEFGEWERNPKSDHPVAKLFQKLKDLLDQIRLAVKEVLGFEPTWKDLFSAAERGEIGSRPEITGERKGVLAQEKQPKLPGLTRQEDLDLFAKARDIGMNAKQYQRYQDLIARRNAEDIEAQLKRALKIEEKKQTKEWKENEAKTRDEVQSDIEQRPDIGVARFFGDGMLYGEKLDKRPKLNSERLTKEQKDGLPETWVADRGIDPDDVAGLFGYQSGSALVDKLIEQTKAREGKSVNKFVESEVEKETARRMEKQFGDLDQNILQEAKDHVLSTTQMDLLHEETVALGMRAGSEMPFAKKDISSWVETEFAKANAEGVKSAKYLDAAGRAGRLAELALLEDNPAEAFRQKQRQYFSTLLAKEARKFEKEQARFDRQMKRFSKREVSGVEQEFTNFIHSLMVQAEIPVRRTVEDIAHEIEKTGYSSFEGFVADKSAAGWELDAPDSILSGDIKSLEKMSVGEFREFRDVVNSLAHIGREVNKIEVGGKKQDFAEWKQDVIGNIQDLPLIVKAKQNKIIYGWDAEWTRLEEIVKDLDLRRELGPLYNGLIRPMMEAKHKEFQLQEKLVKRLNDLRGGNREWRATLNESIPQDFFIDPDTNLPFDLNREQLINIAMNFGNKSSTEKWTQGWFGKDGARQAERQFLDLFEKHLTEADHDFMKKLAGVFTDWKEDSDNMYRGLSGIAPKWLDIPEDGWYWPVIYDKHYSDINVTAEKAQSDSLFGSNYYRATTANGYTNTRTGYIGRIEFQNVLPQLASRMQQVIHDISYRPAVMQASKIIYDKEIRSAIRRHYGEPYERQLDPWLKAIASQYNANEADLTGGNAFLRRTRMNLVVNALGFNLKNLGTPDVGVLTPASIWRAAKFLDDDTKFAMENSREIPHTMKVMDRDFRESLDRTIATQGYEGVQAAAARYAFMPMAQLSKRFRVATFTERYKDARSRGLDHIDAVEVADIAVREFHGATGIPDLPAIMRGSETRKLLTLFYGFGNATYNLQRQIPGAVRRGDWNKAMEVAYAAVLIPTAFGIAFYNSRKENDSWFKILSKGLLLQTAGQTVPVLRDIINFAVEDQSPKTPAASAAQAVWAAVKDAYRAYEHLKVVKPIQHTFNAVGVLAGLPGAQIGRTAQFLHDVQTGQQRPKNFLEYLRGIIHGESKLKK